MFMLVCSVPFTDDSMMSWYEILNLEWGKQTDFCPQAAFVGMWAACCCGRAQLHRRLVPTQPQQALILHCRAVWRLQKDNKDEPTHSWCTTVGALHYHKSCFSGVSSALNVRFPQGPKPWDLCDVWDRKCLDQHRDPRRPRGDQVHPTGSQGSEATHPQGTF